MRYGVCHCAWGGSRPWAPACGWRGGEASSCGGAHWCVSADRCGSGICDSNADVDGGFGDESGAAYSTRCWRVYAIGGCEWVGERSRYGDACNADYARDDRRDSGSEPHAGHGDDYRLRTRRVYVAQHAAHSRRTRDELADRRRGDSEHQDCVERGAADRSEGY